jgi:hypothetical protein
VTTCSVSAVTGLLSRATVSGRKDHDVAFPRRKSENAIKPARPARQTQAKFRPVRANLASFASMNGWKKKMTAAIAIGGNYQARQQADLRCAKVVVPHPDKNGCQPAG